MTDKNIFFFRLSISVGIVDKICNYKLKMKRTPFSSVHILILFIFKRKVKSLSDNESIKYEIQNNLKIKTLNY